MQSLSPTEAVNPKYSSGVDPISLPGFPLPPFDLAFQTSQLTVQSNQSTLSSPHHDDSKTPNTSQTSKSGVPNRKKLSVRWKNLMKEAHLRIPMPNRPRPKRVKQHHRRLLLILHTFAAFSRLGVPFRDPHVHRRLPTVDLDLLFHQPSSAQ